MLRGIARAAAALLLVRALAGPCSAQAQATESTEQTDSAESLDGMGTGSGSGGAARMPVEPSVAAAAPPMDAAMESALSPVTVAILTEEGGALEVTIGGYLEAGFTHSFQEPSNHILAFRGFDNATDTFSLANVALRARFDYDRVYASLTLQWGATPDTYYLAEPSRPALPYAGYAGSSAATYRFLQQAYAGWKIPLLDGISVEAGLFLSPIGFEGMAIRDNWNWSRSNLFFGCPFYHTGIRASTPLGEHLTLHAALFNGWNTVLDNNSGKTVAVWLDYQTDDLSFYVRYMGGPERPDDQNPQWRSLLDASASWRPLSVLTLALHGTTGFEPYVGRDAGYWVAGVGYVRLEPVSWLAITARADVFLDRAPNDDPALRIFWATTPALSSQTLSVQLTPDPHASLFLEYRHDHALSLGPPGTNAAARPTYFGGAVGLDLAGNPQLNRFSQDTFTIGATAGF